jgi:hypothetical protein
MSSNLLYGYGVSDIVLTLATTGGYRIAPDQEQKVVETLGREVEYRLSQIVQVQHSVT